MDHRRTAGFALLCGSALFLIGLLLAETQYPSYSVAHNTISDLGVGPDPAAVLFNGSLFAFGLLGIVAAWLMREASVDRVLWALYAVSALGALGVSLIHEDVRPYHTLAAALAFGGGALAALFSYRMVKRPLSYLSAALGVAALAALVLFSIDAYLGLGVGGMERMVLYPTMVWTVAFGAILTVPERAEGPR